MAYILGRGGGAFYNVISVSLAKGRYLAIHRQITVLLTAALRKLFRIKNNGQWIRPLTPETLIKSETVGLARPSLLGGVWCAAWDVHIDA